MPSSEVFSKFKKKTLRSGSAKGPAVTDPKQAVAIELSEAKAEKANGGKYPEKKKKAADPEDSISHGRGGDPFAVEGDDLDAIKKDATRGLHRARHLGV